MAATVNPVAARIDPDAGGTASRIADAAVRVIARQGLDDLSVRHVAAEAAVSGGTVQHHFPTRSDLTVGALDRAVDRQTRRSASVRADGSPIDRLIAGLAVLLPSDPASRDEAIVWIAMSAATAAGDAAIGERHRAVVRATRRYIATVVAAAQAAGEVAPSLDAVECAALIEAGLDGLMLHAIAGPAGDASAAPAQLATMIRRLTSPGGG